MMEIVAMEIGGVEASDGTWFEAKQKIDGGPSVLYDAVAILTSSDGADRLAKEATAKDFICDAFAHCKFIAHSADAFVLFEKAGIVDDMDDGCMDIASQEDADSFVVMCRDLRYWQREPSVRVVP